MPDIRAWYIYNGTVAGEYTSTNYTFAGFLPTCLTTGPNICAVYGIYDTNYGDHPKPFVMDTNLLTYIHAALIAAAAKPSGPGEKRYVYVRFIT